MDFAPKFKDGIEGYDAATGTLDDKFQSLLTGWYSTIAHARRKSSIY